MPIKYRLLQTFASSKQDPRNYVSASGVHQSKDFFKQKETNSALLQIITERKLVQLIDFPDIFPTKLI